MKWNIENNNCGNSLFNAAAVYHQHQQQTSSAHMNTHNYYQNNPSHALSTHYTHASHSQSSSMLHTEYNPQAQNNHHHQQLVNQSYANEANNNRDLSSANRYAGNLLVYFNFIFNNRIVKKQIIELKKIIIKIQSLIHHRLLRVLLKPIKQEATRAHLRPQM
jgi:hypothetical protein